MPEAVPNDSQIGRIRVVFAGTPHFALTSLRALVESGCQPVAVLTQPDRPAGRGKKLNSSSVKKYALKKELPVLQPASLRNEEVIAGLKSLRADLLVVAAYGLLLPQAVLDLPRVACVNVHASLLPRWRGAAPVQAAILAGDPQTGVCLMRMEAGLDTGPVYARSSLSIGTRETAGELLDRLALQGGELLVKHLPDIAAGKLAAEPQDDGLATHAGKIRTGDAELAWSRSASELQRAIQAFNPVPGAWTRWRGERLKCWSAEVVGDGKDGKQPGSVIGATHAGIEVACGEGRLLLTEVQRPGRTRISAADCARQLDLEQVVLGSPG